MRYAAGEAGAEIQLMRTTVAIVGGGLAGLFAARLLLNDGTEFQLLEARHRFAGRIPPVISKGDPAADGFDLGPFWFWPGMHPKMTRVVVGLGLRASPTSTRPPRRPPSRWPQARSPSPTISSASSRPPTSPWGSRPCLSSTPSGLARGCRACSPHLGSTELRGALRRT